jgi:hypothetical protein
MNLFDLLLKNIDGTLNVSEAVAILADQEQRMATSTIPSGRSKYDVRSNMPDIDDIAAMDRAAMVLDW